MRNKTDKKIDKIKVDLVPKKEITHSGKIFFVGNHIGNLEDVTPRALKTLDFADIVVCEEEKVGAILLKNFNLNKTLLTMNEHNEDETSNEIIELLHKGKNIAVISDAGLPILADPGNLLLWKLKESQIKYSIIPGVSSVTCALLSCGLDTSRYIFYGFMPRKTDERLACAEEIKKINTTVVLLETPYRMRSMLNALASAMPNRVASICLNLTTPQETIITDTLKNLQLKFAEKKLRAEFVLVIADTNFKLSMALTSDENNTTELIDNLDEETTEVANHNDLHDDLDENEFLDFDLIGEDDETEEIEQNESDEQDFNGIYFVDNSEETDEEADEETDEEVDDNDFKDRDDRRRGNRGDRRDNKFGDRDRFGDRDKSGDRGNRGRGGFGDRKFGDRKFGDRKFGDKKFGDRKFGDRDRNEGRRGRDFDDRDKKFGDRKFGDRDRDRDRGGDRRFGENRERGNDDKRGGFGDRKFGDKKFSDRKFSDRKFSDRKFSDRKFSDRDRNEDRRGRDFDDRDFGDRKFGDRDRDRGGDRRFGGNRERGNDDKRGGFGDRKFGDRKFGDRKFGDRDRNEDRRGRDFDDRDKKFGDKKFGDRKFGDRDRDRDRGGDRRFGGNRERGEERRRGGERRGGERRGGGFGRKKR